MAIFLLHKNGKGLEYLPSVMSGRESNDNSGIPSADERLFSIPIGMVVDDAFEADWLESLERVRRSLPLDGKRPTVDRRFFSDQSEQRTIVGVIEAEVKNAILKAHASFGLVKPYPESELFVYCNTYLRILEYTKPGSGLAPHTDGRKVCERRGIESTHTFLLFLSACSSGGHTVIMDGKQGWAVHAQVVVPPNRIYSNCLNERQCVEPHLCDVSESDAITNVSVGVSPQFGRMIFFPHEWPHAGAMCQSVPKGMLRAEVTIEWIQPKRNDSEIHTEL